MGLFVRDVRASVAWLLETRWVFLASVGAFTINWLIAFAGSVNGVVSLLSPLWLVVYVGWLGTERLLYASPGRPTLDSAPALWASAQRLAPRFVRLGILVMVALSPVVAAGAAWGYGAGATRSISIAITTLVYVALTFVTPALALHDEQVRDALRRGVRLLGSHWPEVRWHAVVPALVLGATSASMPLGVMTVPVLGVIAVATPVLRRALTQRYILLVDQPGELVAPAPSMSSPPMPPAG